MVLLHYCWRAWHTHSNNQTAVAVLVPAWIPMATARFHGRSSPDRRSYLISLIAIKITFFRQLNVKRCVANADRAEAFVAPAKEEQVI